MSLAGTAKDTLAIIERGHYTSPSGKTVDIRSDIDQAIAGTTLFRPGGFDALWWEGGTSRPHIEVTPETTAAAARRLWQDGCRDVALLNFASARNPGGGFLGGAKAQEEDLARCSALYPCQLQAPAYYEANRHQHSLLYTDHLIWSPNVPFFKDNRFDLLEEPHLASVVTSPAPNNSQKDFSTSQLKTAFLRRGTHVLSVMATSGCRNIVLGAWGCGVFRNDPALVADTFFHLLSLPTFAGAFDRVIFAVYVRADKIKKHPLLPFKSKTRTILHLNNVCTQRKNTKRAPPLLS